VSNSPSCRDRKVLLSAIPFLFVACAEDTPDPVIVDAGPVAVVSDAAAPPTMRECDIYNEGTTRACTCGTMSGTQACINGVYQPCRCLTVSDAGASGPDLCKAGFYTGEFTGKYKPGAFGLGLFMSFFEVEIMGKSNGTYPALSFTLQEKKEGGGEFYSSSVENGCMVGSASALGTDSPFVARINGSVNCKTGEFTGSITGTYDLVGAPLPFDFTGPLSANFELPQARLNNGVWNVKEPASLSGEASGGGGGTWSAIWDKPAAPAGEDPCAKLDSKVDGGSAMPSGDAGATSTQDAGTGSVSVDSGTDGG
jgi:hypothetical protein